MLKDLGIGLLVAAVGALLVYFEICQPYVAMSERQGDVSYSWKAQLVGPIMLATGLALLIAAVFPSNGAVTQAKKGWSVSSVLMAGLLALGPVASVYIIFFWFPAEAARFGYG